jgi:hypothetical protein
MSDFKEPIHYDEHGMAWPHDLWQQKEALREAAERQQKIHNDKAMFRITLASTVVAVAAAVGALWSGYEAHQTRIEDERPYIRTEFAGFALENSHDLKAPGDNTPDSASQAPHIKLNVFGKSPAIGVDVLSSCEYSNGKDIETENDIEDLGFIFPSENRTITCKPARKPYQAVRVFGVVSYTDVHDKDYRTPFCFAEKEVNVEPCTANNVE